MGRSQRAISSSMPCITRWCMRACPPGIGCACISRSGPARRQAMGRKAGRLPPSWQCILRVDTMPGAPSTISTCRGECPAAQCLSGGDHPSHPRDWRRPTTVPGRPHATSTAEPADGSHCSMGDTKGPAAPGWDPSSPEPGRWRQQVGALMGFRSAGCAMGVPSRTRGYQSGAATWPGYKLSPWANISTTPSCVEKAHHILGK